jgi:membrane fusion protein (multidrug efflux system)
MLLNRIAHTLPETLAAVALMGTILLSGCGKPPAADGPSPMGMPEVAVVTVQPEPIALTAELPGRTGAFRVAEVRPQVNGLILKRLFEEGSEVKAGQVLYEIDPAPFQAALENAQAALARAQANLPAIQLRAKRLEELLPDKAVSQQDTDDAVAAVNQVQAEIESWKAQVKMTRINLAYCRIVAPISGLIGKSNVTEGAIVTAYQPTALATILQLDPIYVDVAQSTTELLRLKRRLEDGHLNRDGANQDKVRLILDDDTAYPLDGRLQFQDVTVDPTTGSVILRVVFPNPQGVLLPGMFVRAVITEGIHPQAILVPQQAVVRDAKGNSLALKVDAEGKLKPQMLTLDRAIGDQWLVSEGLAPGDRLIVEGLQRVERMPPGTSVKAVAFQKAEEKPGMPENRVEPAASK